MFHKDAPIQVDDEKLKDTFHRQVEQLAYTTSLISLIQGSAELITLLSCGRRTLGNGREGVGNAHQRDAARQDDLEHPDEETAWHRGFDPGASGRPEWLNPTAGQIDVPQEPSQVSRDHWSG